MSREQVAAELRLAERDVAQGAQDVAHQQDVIARLEVGGHPTAGARELLETFRIMQRIHVPERDRLVKALRAAQ